MNESSTNRARGLIGAAALVAAIAVAGPAISAADRGGDDDRDRTVGTIESFDPDTGTLVIAPESGDDVIGTVNERTRIDCEREDGDDDHGDDGPNHDADDDRGGDDHGGSGPGKHGGRDRRGNCSPDDLEPGSAVEEAELEIRVDGLVYEEVELR